MNEKLNAEKIQNFVDTTKELENQLAQLKSQKINIEAQIIQLEQQQQQFISENEKPIKEMMQELGLKQLKTMNGDLIKLKTVNPNKLSYWSVALDKQGKEKLSHALKDKKYQNFVKEQTTYTPKIKELKEAIKENEFSLDEKGRVITPEGELLLEEPVFKLREEHLGL